MKTINTYIIEKLHIDKNSKLKHSLTPDERIKKWWENSKVGPKYLITKENNDTVIISLKFLGLGAHNFDYDDFCYNGGTYECAVKYGKKVNINNFKEPNWIPYVDGNKETWKDILHDSQFSSKKKIWVYKGPQDI